MATRTPERIGSYRLIRLLGKGKACEVWEVERGSDSRRLAMKLLVPSRPAATADVRSLRHEFRVGRGIKHAQVIETIDFQSSAGATYLILELFRAPNLKQRIQQSSAALAPIAETIVRGAAAGLAHVHTAGWVHCDVKPDNFLVDDEGHVKLIDFNIARRQPGFLARLWPFRSPLQGTPSYMSPEQIRGRRIDRRADVYSFGCVVYELFSGKPPFTAGSTQDLLTRHLTSRPAPLAVAAPAVHPDFSRLVMRALEKELAGRLSSIDEFLNGLDTTQVFRDHKPNPR